MAILSLTAYLTSWVYVFPSLGPTVFLIFYFPSAAISAPRNTVLGHLAGIVIGVVSFQVLEHIGIAQHSHLVVLSSGVSMGILSMFMALTGVLHPPAASSCLIASLGLVKSYYQGVGMIASVVVICAVGFVLNRLAGIEYPLWNPSEAAPLPKIKTVLGDVSETKQKDKIEELAAKLAMRQKIDED